MKHFFDLHSRFFETSVVGTKSGQGKSQRLYRRYEAIIRYPYEIYRDNSVLDIGSHDARWSIAALDAGAKFVIGVEPRQSLVHKAIENAELYGYPDKVNFLPEDIFRLLPSFKPGQFAVVLCLRIFYHIMDHYRLMRSLRRLRLG